MPQSNVFQLSLKVSLQSCISKFSFLDTASRHCPSTAPSIASRLCLRVCLMALPQGPASQTLLWPPQRFPQQRSQQRTFVLICSCFCTQAFSFIKQGLDKHCPATNDLSPKEIRSVAQQACPGLEPKWLSSLFSRSLFVFSCR